ncbi:hypothetical protein [Pseudomonas knackmussii]|uniref:hypothetical protein n=1 Tax=Pseudomonas knackmussii TaxID=65741 RepID=UPI003F4A6C34
MASLHQSLCDPHTGPDHDSASTEMTVVGHFFAFLPTRQELTRFLQQANNRRPAQSNAGNALWNSTPSDSLQSWPLSSA